jgi:hypothetical protein
MPGLDITPIHTPSGKTIAIVVTQAIRTIVNEALSAL